MKKVCIIAPNFLEPRSWMVSAYKTALLLKQIGYEVIVITSKTKGSKAYEEIEGVKIYRKPCFFIPDPFNYTAIPFFTSHLSKLIKKEKPDLFIVNKYMFYTSLSTLYLKLKGKKVIQQTDTFPGYNWFSRNKFMNFCIWLYTRTFGKLVLKLSDLVIMLHEGNIPVAEKLKLNWKVIHNGVDYKKFSKAKPAKDIVKLKGKRKLVTYVGRLDAVKGADVLVNAIKEIDRDDLHFLFVCGNKDPHIRKKYSKMLGSKATFLGFRKDVVSIMKASDVYVLPSFTEGLPNTLMEAMACGLPCVATKVGGVPCLLGRENGIVIKKGSSSELIKNIEKLADDPKLREKLGTNAKKQIEKNFSFESVKKEWRELLK